MDIWGQQLIDGLSNEQLALIVLVQVWEMIWKGFALWRAARNRDIFWFVLLILINSAGLLPAVYLFYISKSPRKRLGRIHIVPRAGGDREEPEEKSPKKKTKKK